MRLLRLLALLLAFACLNATAATPPNPEIDQLLATLGHSQCQFYRNGTWYDAAAAQAHLLKKYQYLHDHKLAETTEQFIDNGATKSSMSGEAYQVRCGEAPAQPSAQWLREQLRSLRAAGAPH